MQQQQEHQRAKGSCDSRFASQWRRKPAPLSPYPSLTRSRVQTNPASLESECRSTMITAPDSNDVNCQFRKMRNLSEKKRRDQFNLLINELCSMVSTTARKMDKTSVLKSTIAFLRNHNEMTRSSEDQQVHQEDWKPSFLSNEEFVHLMLEALDSFIIAFAPSGQISYVSESIASLLGYLPSDVLNMTIYDLVHEDSRMELYQILASHSSNIVLDSTSTEGPISFINYMKRGPLDANQTDAHELVQFVGTYVQWNPQDVAYDVSQSEGGDKFVYSYSDDDQMIPGTFVATVRLQTPQLLREMSLFDDMSKSEFTSRHSLEWKFLFLDHRAPPIIGYNPFELLGMSGYDYYHVDDMEMIVACHEALMQTGEGRCSYYRFLTKGQQWIWLQTRYYITYHQWNSKPEFIVCTHIAVSCAVARMHMRKDAPTITNANPQVENTRQHCRNKPSGQSLSSTSIQKHANLHVLDENIDSGWSPSKKPKNENFVYNSLDQNFLEPQMIDHQNDERSQFRVPMMMVAKSMEPAMTGYQTSMPMRQASHNQCDMKINPMTVANSTEESDDLHEQLRRKHHILQETILQQQEELKRVQEQLMFAQFVPQNRTPTTAADDNQESKMPYTGSGNQLQ